MAMNVFRFIGDMSHLASFFFLLQRIYTKRNVAGISLKTLELYLLVFLTRYLDLFFSYISLYNTTMKMLYIGMSAAVVYLIRFVEPWKSSYKEEEDTFLHLKFGVAPCAVLALIINADHFNPLEILWTFSIYLEAIAIFPQCIVMRRYKEIENLTSHYVLCLGIYRAFYILNWIYRAYTEKYYHSHWIVWISGVVQTLLYVDFFYFYVQSKYGGKGKGSKGVLIPETM